MIQCPECRSMIPDDSAFCDQCGKELKWCPDCKRPKRGTECPVCGSDLIPGRKYLSGVQGTVPTSSSAASAPTSPKRESAPPVQATVAHPEHQPTVAAVARPAALVGNGWRLTLRPGDFGRNGGIWPELGSCPYVSGSHGMVFDRHPDWKIADRGSTNGTFVNGRKLSAFEECPLKKGDRVRIATLDFTVE